MFMCVIQAGVRNKFIYGIEGLFATEKVNEYLNAKMSCL